MISKESNHAEREKDTYDVETMVVKQIRILNLQNVNCPLNPVVYACTLRLQDITCYDRF